MATASTYVLTSVTVSTQTAVATYTASDASVHTITIAPPDNPADLSSLVRLQAQIGFQIDNIEQKIAAALSAEVSGAVGHTYSYSVATETTAFVS